MRGRWLPEVKGRWLPEVKGRWLLVAALVGGCAPILPPDVLGEVDQARSAPAVVEATADAPLAAADAERLRVEAHRAFEEGDFAGAQILGEQALAAYQKAIAAARATRAEKQAVEAEAEALGADEKLEAIEAEHQRLAADIAALERRIDTLDGEASGAPSGEAARALQFQARLLCSAAKLLSSAHAKDAGFAEPAAVTEAQAQLATMDRQGEAPLEAARSAREACLAALTQVRRAVDAALGNAALGDAALGNATQGAELVEELSRAGFEPRRSDGGVSVTLRGVFRGEALTEAASAEVKRLADIAKARAKSPLMVVLHQQQEPAGAELSRWRTRAMKLAAAVEEVTGAAPEVHIAGVARPLTDPKGKHAARNERVEVLFVTSTMF